MLNRISSDVMESLEDHPGFIGSTSRGVIAIHADWPAYALNHGWAYALSTFGQFPAGKVFHAIDDIDHCFLFLAVEPKLIGKDPFDERHFHVALWHEDLLEFIDRGYVSSVHQITPREWTLRRCDQLRSQFAKLAEDKYASVPMPNPDDFNDDEATAAMIRSEGVLITGQGFEALQKILAQAAANFMVYLPKRVCELVQLKYFDTAVRDACVVVESRLRAVTKSNKFGQALVEEFILELRRTRHYVPARLKVFRNELRTAFKHIRNAFMHAVQVLSQVECYAILTRLAWIFSALDSIDRGESLS